MSLEREIDEAIARAKQLASAASPLDAPPRAKTASAVLGQHGPTEVAQALRKTAQDLRRAHARPITLADIARVV